MFDHGPKGSVQTPSLWAKSVLPGDEYSEYLRGVNEGERFAPTVSESVGLGWAAFWRGIPVRDGSPSWFRRLAMVMLFLFVTTGIASLFPDSLQVFGFVLALVLVPVLWTVGVVRAVSPRQML